MTRYKEAITTENYTYTAIFEPYEEGGFVVYFPAIPDLMTQGETLEEAREMASECLQCYLEALQEDGQNLPVEEITGKPVLERIQVTLEKV